MDIEEVKEKLTKRMAEAHSDYMEEPVGGEYADGYASGCEYAINLLENLQPKKVVIPQFVADWIEKAAQPSNLATISVMHSDAIRYGKHIDWFKNHDNQRLLLKALLYGYKVKNKTEKYVRLKGFAGNVNYLNYDVNSKEFFVDTTGLGSGIKIKFTKRWLKDYWSEYDAYNNAELLEFEEIEND